MVQVQTATPMTSALHQTDGKIPAITHQEAMTMSAEELRRFLALIESLADDDWDKPTACTIWTVKDIVAHQAAHVQSLTSLGAFISQFNPALIFPYLRKGMNFLDAWNQSQVDLRRNRTPSELIAEIRSQAARSLQGKDKVPALLRNLTLAAPGLDQPRSMGYVFDLIYTRDMWMHQIDIYRATGRTMPLNAVHDVRTVALILRDLTEKSVQGLAGRSAILELTGTAGGRYQIGANTAPTAVITIDALAFCILASGRETAENILATAQVTISGDSEFGKEVLHFSENRVLF